MSCKLRESKTGKYIVLVNSLTFGQELFAKTQVLDILEIFRLDMGQISSNLFSMLCFPLASHFTTFLAQARAEIKILRPKTLGFLVFLSETPMKEHNYSRC